MTNKILVASALAAVMSMSAATSTQAADNTRRADIGNRKIARGPTGLCALVSIRFTRAETSEQAVARRAANRDICASNIRQ